MADSDIEVVLRYRGFCFHDIAISIIRSFNHRFDFCVGAGGNLVHLPEDVLEELFLGIIHCSDFLGYIWGSGGLDGINSQNFLPHRAGTGHLQNIIAVGCLDLRIVVADTVR